MSVISGARVPGGGEILLSNGGIGPWSAAWMAGAASTVTIRAVSPGPRSIALMTSSATWPH
jgi:hypothetical protein